MRTLQQVHDCCICTFCIAFWPSFFLGVLPEVLQRSLIPSRMDVAGVAITFRPRPLRYPVLRGASGICTNLFVLRVYYGPVFYAYRWPTTHILNFLLSEITSEIFSDLIDIIARITCIFVHLNMYNLLM